MPQNTPAIKFSGSASEVEVYDFLEVTLDVREAKVANPFTDAVVKGEFAPNGEDAVAVDGFCDAPDGNLYRMPEDERAQYYFL